MAALKRKTHSYPCRLDSNAMSMSILSYLTIVISKGGCQPVNKQRYLYMPFEIRHRGFLTSDCDKQCRAYTDLPGLKDCNFINRMLFKDLNYSSYSQ